MKTIQKEYSFILPVFSFISLFLFLLWGSACNKRAQKALVSTPPQLDSALLHTLPAALDRVFLEEMEDNHIPGMAVVLVKDGKTIYKKGYGLADVEHGREVDPDQTIFRIGSISKALTLLTLSRLVDDGRLQLDEEVSQYFPHIENPKGFEMPVSIRHLLTHTTGFDQIGIGRVRLASMEKVERQKQERPSLAEFLKKRNLRRINPPGQYYRYDTYAPTLAGLIIEKVTGLPYTEAMRKELFEPLGMDRSHVEAAPEHHAALSRGYGYLQGEYQAMDYELYRTLPASSIDATVADMGRLLEALTGEGANVQGRLFSREMAEALYRPQFRPHPEFLGMRYGLGEESMVGQAPDAYPVASIGHGGDMLGYTSLMTVIPSWNMGFFVVANRNREAGGDRVRLWPLLMNAMMTHLGVEKKMPVDPVPSKKHDLDLEEYTGAYYYGSFCHTCTAAEHRAGAWRRPRPMQVRLEGKALEVRGESYLPRGDDVFIRSDGYRKLFFGRDEKGNINFLVFSDDRTSFERLAD
ncbi:MAG: serine hydrolase domain-containing protein [Bacteroidota bacterium]